MHVGLKDHSMSFRQAAVSDENKWVEFDDEVFKGCLDLWASDSRALFVYDEHDNGL